MGESLVKTAKLENKMSDSVTHIPCLQESVSFGRFEHDSLCWERWSAFPTNKYLEEVEKCSTPGSVAQKKAYFEAHYKRIAARKAELLEEEKKREAGSVTEDQTSRVSVWDTSEEDLDVERSSGPNCSEATELFNEIDDDNAEVSDKHIDIPINSNDVLVEENEVVNLKSEVIEHIDELSGGVDAIDQVNQVGDPLGEVGECIDVLGDEVDVIEETKDIQTEHIDEMICGLNKVVEEDTDTETKQENANENLHLIMEIPELPVEPVLLKEDTTSTHGVWQDKEVLPQGKVEEREIVEEETKKPMELVDPTKIKKPTLVKKATYAANAKKKPSSTIPKKPVSPIPKKHAAVMPRSPMISTPKSGKPEPKQTAKSTTSPGLKKETGYTPLTSKKGTRPETKRVLPASLHMSLSYGPSKPEPTTMRKSLIMESMGDKDIVKRAFKAFQNPSVSQSCVVKSTDTPQSATKRAEHRVSTPDSLEKKKEGITRATKGPSPCTSQQGMRKSPQSFGLKKSIGVDQRNDKAVSASFGYRSLDNGRQQKQVAKKVELKPNTKDAAKTPLQSKLKADKAAADIGKQSHKLSSKAKLSSINSKGHGFLRGSVRQEDAKI